MADDALEVHYSTLSAEECHALLFCLAMTDPQHYEARYVAACREEARLATLSGKRLLTAHERRALTARGIGLLAEKGLVSVKRGAEGDWEPAHVHLDRLILDQTMETGPRIVIGDGN